VSVSERSLRPLVTAATGARLFRLGLVTTILIALSGPAFAQDNATVQKLADQFAEAFNKDAAAGVGEMYAEDALLVPPQADIRMGRKDIQAFWTQQAKQAEALSVAVRRAARSLPGSRA
jgi:hypothetical protein